MHRKQDLEDENTKTLTDAAGSWSCRWGGVCVRLRVCVCTYILYRYRYRDRYRQKRRTQAQIRISKCVYTHRHKQEGYGIYSSCHGAAE